MRRKLIFGAAGCCVILFMAGAGIAYRDAGRMARYDRTLRDASTVGRFVYQYHEEYGKYPSSLPELASKGDPPYQKLVNQVLANWQNQYHYEASTNGVTVVLGGYRYEYQPRLDGYVIIGEFSTNLTSYGGISAKTTYK